MATGERGFSTADTKKTKRNFDPIPAGDYDFKLLGKQAEIRVAEPRKNEKTGKMSQPVPRVSLRFEALDTAAEGGKNKLLFHDLYTSMVPDKGGILAPTGADQLKGLADGLGVEADIPFQMYTPKGSTTPIKILNPRVLLEWIKAHDGQVVRAAIKIQAGTKDYPEPKNKLTEFFEAGGESSEESSEEAPADGEEFVEEASESSDDAALEELPSFEEEEPTKPAKATAKPAARPAAKPAHKKR